MNVTKTIKFYILQKNPSLYFNGLHNSISDETFKIFKTAFPDQDYYSFILKKKTYFFDILEYSNDGMFGTCSVEESLEPTSFVRTRNKKTNQTNSLTFSDKDELLESYTFFYIDFKKNRMAVIVNKKISNLHECLSQFIWEKSGNTASINILPEKIDDLKKASKELQSYKELELGFFTPSSNDNIQSLKQTILGYCDIENYRIKVKLSKVKPQFIDRLLIAKNNKEVDSIILQGKNDLGLDETINFFEAVYSKTVPIELSDDTVRNINYIKDQLIKYLNAHLGILG